MSEIWKLFLFVKKIIKLEVNYLPLKKIAYCKNE